MAFDRPRRPAQTLGQRRRTERWIRTKQRQNRITYSDIYSDIGRIGSRTSLLPAQRISKARAIAACQVGSAR